MISLSSLLKNIYQGKFDVTKHRMFIERLKEKNFEQAIKIRKDLFINQSISIKQFYQTKE